MVRVAICFHLGYYHRFDEFTPYIDNVIRCCPHSDLYITYREDIDPMEVTHRCQRKYPKATVFKAIQGCDTGAFLLQIKAIIASHKSYDLIFKIHTKSNSLYANTWIRDLLDPVSGSKSQVKRVLRKFDKDHKIGMIGSKKWLLRQDIEDSMFRDVCQRNHLSMDGFFVGGTIFWARWIVLQRAFMSIDLDKEYSLCEQGKPSEPSYTHSWERIFGLLVSNCGCRIKGVKYHH
jgi:lipopolysaccharide biosynthesis protein